MALIGVPARAVLAVGTVCMRGKDVLMVRRGQPPREGEWSIPGGRIEFGERAHVAALRELFEETAVQADVLGLIDVVDAVFTSRQSGDVTRHYLLLDYAARWVSGTPRAGDDAAEACFVSPEDLAAMTLWDETRRVIAAGVAMIEACEAKGRSDTA